MCLGGRDVWVVSDDFERHIGTYFGGSCKAKAWSHCEGAMNLPKFHVHDALSSDVSTIPSLAHSFFRVVRNSRDIRTVDEVAFCYRIVMLQFTNHKTFEYTPECLVKRLKISEILQSKRTFKVVTCAGRRVYINVLLRPRLEVANGALWRCVYEAAGKR